MASFKESDLRVAAIGRSADAKACEATGLKLKSPQSKTGTVEVVSLTRIHPRKATYNLAVSNLGPCRRSDWKKRKSKSACTH